MEYLIDGTDIGLSGTCIIQPCTCQGGSVYVEPCSKTVEPCACKANFCGGEVCYPVKMIPAAVRIKG